MIIIINNKIILIFFLQIRKKKKQTIKDLLFLRMVETFYNIDSHAKNGHPLSLKFNRTSFLCYTHSFISVNIF